MKSKKIIVWCMMLCLAVPAMAGAAEAEQSTVIPYPDTGVSIAIPLDWYEMDMLAYLAEAENEMQGLDLPVVYRLYTDAQMVRVVQVMVWTDRLPQAADIEELEKDYAGAGYWETLGGLDVFRYRNDENAVVGAYIFGDEALVALVVNLPEGMLEDDGLLDNMLAAVTISS